jgi:hypothetical protein
MTPQIERRQRDRRSLDDELSPEYLALLKVCGGEIRSSDRPLLAARHPGEDDAPQAGSREGVDADRRAASPVATDRRRPVPG